ncbi:hypothetical protein [Pelagibacterium lentulum]|uniref:hypothetical protein n=1 Tax=Pelagibacterium lentulum TaxID=2029865 RepID=UPI0013E061BE|nr:hypothetical protein [Pelagibacterium lentulum]
MTASGSYGGELFISIDGYGDKLFLLSLFRPLIDRSQSDDIAMFKAIANRGLAQNEIQVSEDA